MPQHILQSLLPPGSQGCPGTVLPSHSLARAQNSSAAISALWEGCWELHWAGAVMFLF